MLTYMLKGTLIDQDNDLFRKLLALYDTIAELRDRQQEAEEISDNDEVDCLGSLSDADNQTSTISPSSTLSSCSSHNVLKKTQFRPLWPRGKSMLDSSEYYLSKNSNDCSRCSPNPMLPQYNRRRTRSYGTLYYRNDESLSYDSGIYLQGPHSDSEHEIFV
ncbi:uncharacterized protein LOC143244855 isoform X2 [Tachypleus tridentatus]|uniref:uncharacterized protein LOC143244855 isoform X2 n=1 Tax=Tachypleus tridentatus TaxID=6853 RepID=UPI003FD165E2